MTSSLVCLEPRNLLWSGRKTSDDEKCISDNFTFGGEVCNLCLWEDPVKRLCILTLISPTDRRTDFFYTVIALDSHLRSFKSDATRRRLLRSASVNLWQCEESYIKQKRGNSAGEYYFFFHVQFYECEVCASSYDTRKGNFLGQTDKCVQTTLNMNVMDKCVQTALKMNAVSCVEKLSKDLGKLLEEGSPQDVVLKCGDHTIGAQRSILCSRSPVFAAILRSGMEEDKSGLVEIRDMDGDVFQQFIRYIYTGTLPELTVDDARRLYVAADQYAVEKLMRRCADFLTDNLTSDNACDLLVLADTHSDQKFKEDVVTYIVNEKVHLENEQWLAFCDDHPRLASIVLNRFCKLQK